MSDSAGTATDAGSGPPVVTELVDAVLRVRLNRPRARNALDWPLRRELLRVLTGAGDDSGVRVVVLSGDERAFCAGGDLKESGTSTADTSAKLVLAAALLRAITGLPKPVVAEVRGFAGGAGFGLALACDVVLADETAVFRSAVLPLGLVPDLGTAWSLTRQVGRHRAMEILLSGRDVPAAEAAALGLVAHCWTQQEFRSRADAYERLLASRPPTALGLTKQLVDGSCGWDQETALEVERMSQLLAVASEEHRAYLIDAARPPH